MGHNVFSVVVYVVFAMICIGLSLSGFLPKRKIKGILDKTTVYLFAEYSYQPEKIFELLERIKKKHTPFSVPLSVTWAGAVKPQFEKLSNVSSMFSGLCVLSIFASEWLGYPFLKSVNPNFYSVGLILLFIVVSFAYYFRSVASDLFSLEEKSSFIAELLVDEHFLDIGIDAIDEIYSQIKIDLDVYKSSIGFGGILLLLMTTLISFSKKGEDILSSFAGVSLMILTGSITIFKWVYDNYRSRIIQIALNALIIVKKSNYKNEPNL